MIDLRLDISGTREVISAPQQPGRLRLRAMLIVRGIGEIRPLRRLVNDAHDARRTRIVKAGYGVVVRKIDYGIEKSHLSLPAVRIGTTRSRSSVALPKHKFCEISHTQKRFFD